MFFFCILHPGDEPFLLSRPLLWSGAGAFLFHLFSLFFTATRDTSYLYSNVFFIFEFLFLCVLFMCCFCILLFLLPCVTPQHLLPEASRTYFFLSFAPNAPLLFFFFSIILITCTCWFSSVALSYRISQHLLPGARQLPPAHPFRKLLGLGGGNHATHGLRSPRPRYV